MLTALQWSEGGHLDLAILVPIRSPKQGILPTGRLVRVAFPAVGGAMDLVHGAKRVAVVTDHVTKKGQPKLVEACTMPLTGVTCVTRIYSSLAVIDICDKHFVLREKLSSISFDDLQAVTGAPLVVDGSFTDLIVPTL